jgi:hypothetical protein
VLVGRELGMMRERQQQRGLSSAKHGVQAVGAAAKAAAHAQRPRECDCGWRLFLAAAGVAASADRPLARNSSNLRCAVGLSLPRSRPRLWLGVSLGQQQCPLPQQTSVAHWRVLAEEGAAGAINAIKKKEKTQNKKRDPDWRSRTTDQSVTIVPYYSRTLYQLS